MKPFKIKEANFNPETGESFVSLYTDMGIVTGTAKLHPDDAESKSNYFGCRIAENRAVMKYCRRRAEKARVEYQAVLTFFKSMEGTRTFSVDAFYVKQLLGAMDRKQKEIKMWKCRAATLKEQIIQSIAIRDAMIKKVEGGKA